MCSYKEQSEGSTNEEDLIDASELADDAASQDEPNAETIEKVIRHRIGRKGGMLTYPVSCSWRIFSILVFQIKNILYHQSVMWGLGVCQPFWSAV